MNTPEKRVCLDCKNEYEYSYDTLQIAVGNTGQCPDCGSKNVEVKELTMEEMEAFFGKNWRRYVKRDGTIKQ